MKPIRWGIIGCGDVTEVKSGPGFQKADRSALVAVMRRNGELAKDYAQRHRVPRWYDRADDIINDPEVDALYIATPPAFHMEYAIKCALAGKPVCVEKPMAVNYADCQAMIEACRANGVPLFVAYYRRALDYFIKIKELVEGGAIGEVRYVSVAQYQAPIASQGETLPWRVVPELSGGGLFHDVAAHTLDILDFILGPVSQAHGASANQSKAYTASDMVTAHFEFASGVHGVGVWCFNAYRNEERNEIVGSKGKITFTTFAGSPITVETQQGTESYSFENPLHVQQPLIQSIVNELNGSGQSPSHGDSAGRTNWVMDEILKGGIIR